MKRIIIPLLFLIAFSISAQENSKFILPKFQNLDLKDGLTNLNIFSIVQDDLGYIWIATARGINRYDGTGFKHYLFSEDENSLYHDMVSNLFKNQSGYIFCSTNYGTNIFDTNQDRMFHMESNKGIFYDFIDFGSETYGISNISGLCRFNEKSLSFERLQQIKNDLILNNLYSEINTGIWAKSSDQSYLVNYNPNTNVIEKYKIPFISEKESDGPLVIIDSTIFFTGKQFFTFNIKSREFSPLPEKWNNLSKIKNLKIWCVEQVDKNILWIGTRTKGLYIFNLETNTLTNLNKENSDLKSNWPTCVFKDRDENIWLGTFDHGVHIAFKDRGNVNFDNILNKLTSDVFINSITSDNSNNYYIGTRYDGFYVYNSDSKNVRHFHTENSFLSSNHIRTIFIDSEDKLWISTEKALHIFNPVDQSINEFYISGSNEGLSSICEQAGKVIGCSDSQGLFIFELDGTFYKKEIKLGLIITQSIPINQEEIIVASYDKGLSIYNINSSYFREIYKETNSEGVNINQSSTIYLDSDTILWIGNYVTGLHKLDLRDNSVSVYTMMDGLPNNDIVGIVEDNSGKLWLSTSYGMSRFDKKEEFVNYFYNEGLENLQFHTKAAYIDHKGIIYFGGSTGLTFFDPKVLVQTVNKKAPKIILESLSVLNKVIEPGDDSNILSVIINKTPEIKLSHKQNVLTIDYHAFDYIAADEIRYTYIMEGLENKWNNVGKRTYANFSNLQPGTYHFKIKAQNNKGIMSEASSLKIIIKPSPFLTVLAFIIYLIILITITYISFRLILNAKLYKNKLLLEHNERLREKEVALMKMRFFANISHEIKTPLTLIKGNVDNLSMELPEISRNTTSFNGLRNSTERLLRLVNQLLLVRKLENDALDLQIKNDDIVSISNKLIQSYMFAATGRKITIGVESDFEELIMPIDEDKYEKIISNFLSNSLKHARDNGLIKIRIQELEESEIKDFFENEKELSSKRFIKISVVDNGSGIPKKDLPNIFNRFELSETDKSKPDYSGTGIGLNFTRRLIELHQSSIRVSSIENVETIFSFALSLDAKTYDDEKWLKEQKTAKEDVLSENMLPILQESEDSKDNLILLVEDDLELNRFITTSLKKHFKVVSCFNGREGYNLAQNHFPNIIISDIMMPEMDGFRLCEKIRKNELIAHIPVILLTAKSDAESKVMGFEYGADEYISKPFDMNMLIARIFNLIDIRKNLQKSYKYGILDDTKVEYTNQYELTFVKRIESIVAGEYHSTELNVNYLADKMNMSRTSFYRKFLSVMDVSPKDLITKYRINKAIELIKSGNNNFGEITHLCGFGSQSNFSALFKKEKGMSPLQFKKSLESGSE